MIKEVLQQNIKRARKIMGLSQVKFAELLEVSDQAVNSWETGRRAPEYPLIEKIAEKVGRDPLWFYRDNSKEDEGFVTVPKAEWEQMLALKRQLRMAILGDLTFLQRSSEEFPQDFSPFSAPGLLDWPVDVVDSSTERLLDDHAAGRVLEYSGAPWMVT